MKKTKKTILFFVASVLSLLSINAQSVEQVSPIKAKLMARNGDLMIDVREVKEVKEIAYDVENSINIPLSEFENRLKEIPKDKKLIMVCASGNRSQQAANILIKHGYINVVNMTGGIAAWQAKNLAVIKNGVVTKKTCCSKGNSKSCSKKNKEAIKSKCCSDPKSKNCKPDGTCKSKNK